MMESSPNRAASMPASQAQLRSPVTVVPHTNKRYKYSGVSAKQVILVVGRTVRMRKHQQSIGRTLVVSLSSLYSIEPFVY